VKPVAGLRDEAKSLREPCSATCSLQANGLRDGSEHTAGRTGTQYPKGALCRVLLDRALSAPVVMASSAGGVDIRGGGRRKTRRRSSGRQLILLLA